MPTADFYLMPEPTLKNCYSLVCKLIDKAYQLKRSVYVLVDTETEATTLDDLLWTFRDDAFIPHSLYGQSEENIQIGIKQRPEKFNDILLNLTQDIPDYFSEFQRILEIVPQDQKEISRKKYRFYKNKNCEVTTHDLSKDSR